MCMGQSCPNCASRFFNLRSNELICWSKNTLLDCEGCATGRLLRRDKVCDEDAKLDASELRVISGGNTSRESWPPCICDMTELPVRYGATNGAIPDLDP